MVERMGYRMRAVAVGMLAGCALSHSSPAREEADAGAARDLGFGQPDSGVPADAAHDAMEDVDAGPPVPLPLCERPCWGNRGEICPPLVPDVGAPCSDLRASCEYCGVDGPLLFTGAYCTNLGWSVLSGEWCEG